MNKSSFLASLLILFFVFSCSQDDGVDVNAKHNNSKPIEGGSETNKDNCTKYQDCTYTNNNYRENSTARSNQ